MLEASRRREGLGRRSRPIDTSMHVWLSAVQPAAGSYMPPLATAARLGACGSPPLFSVQNLGREPEAEMCPLCHY